MTTLFIVGAGASAEAGLPTGKELTTEVARKLNFRHDGLNLSGGDKEILRALYQHAQTDDGHVEISPYIEAAKQTSEAMPLAPSIDSFIDAHQGNERIETCGKLAIVQSILEAEINSHLYMHPMAAPPQIDFNKIEETWFNKFWQILTKGCRKDSIAERIGRVEFIIFNYDRCIEHFLYHALQSYYGISDDEAANHLASLNIYHPYGTVGYLPWQNGANDVPFGDQKAGPDLLSRSTEIKTFTERIEDQSAVDEMRCLVQAAEDLVFLGFAFHQQNMDLISPAALPAVSRVFATTSGISPSDVGVVRDQIVGLLKTEPPEMHLKDEKCSRFFDEYSRTISLS